MWWSKKSQQSQVLCVDRQEFSIAEEKCLEDVSRLPLFKKMRKELHCELVSKMLFTKTDDSYRKGWLDCMNYVDTMVEMYQSKRETIDRTNVVKDSEVTSMQMDDE